MRTITKITLLAILAFNLQSCTFVRFKDSEGGDRTTKVASKVKGTSSFDVADFNSIECTLPADIEYFISESEPSVTVEGPINVLDQLQFEVIDGKLFMKPEETLVMRSVSNLKIRLNSSSLEGVSIKGAGDFSIPDGLEAESFNLTIQGAGDVDIDGLKCKSVEVTILGAGDVEISRLECETVSSTIKGAGDVVLEGRADRAVVDVSGSGEVDMSGLRVSDVESKGMGKIKR